MKDTLIILFVLALSSFLQPLHASDSKASALDPCDSFIVHLTDIPVNCTNSFPFPAFADTTTPLDSLIFTWTNDGNVVGTDWFYFVEEMGEYILTVEYPEHGCVFVDTVEFVIDMNPPTADAGPDVELADCPSAEVELVGTGTTTSAFLNFAWTDEMGNTISNEATAFVSEVGTYTLIATNPSNGCTATDEASVYIGQEVELSIESTPDSCDLSIGTATAIFTPEQSDATFLWSNGSTEPSVSGLPYGIHAVSVQWGTCPLLALSIFVDSVACQFTLANEIHELNKAKLFPNPIDDFSTLNLHVEKKIELEIYITDIVGKKISSPYIKRNFSKGEHAIDLDLKNIPAGINFLKIKSGNRHKLIKMMKN